ncbi:MAG: hypothetical protein LBM38_06010 [Clostridiales bacterium]|nr:hypothetical protein [Clostridiales bacterium]
MPRKVIKSGKGKPKALRATHARVKNSVKVNYNRIFVIAIIALVCLYFSKGFIIGFFNNVKTSLVLNGSAEQTVSTDGFMLREESVIAAPSSGTLVCMANDGERVPAGSLIASVYNGKVDETVQAKLNKVNQQISELQSLAGLVYSDDNSEKTESQIASIISSIVIAAKDTNLSGISEYKYQLNNMISRTVVEDKQTTLESLQAQKNQLEASLGNARKDIYAPRAGVFASKLDGYENTFDVVNRNKLKPESLEAIDKSKTAKFAKEVTQEQAVCKIVDNYMWYYATIMDTKTASLLTVGQAITLEFPSVSSKKLKASVDSINYNETDKTVVVFACDEEWDSMFVVRNLSAEVGQKTYSGLKVPISSIHVENGVTGVYVISDNKCHFKPTTVLYSDENSAIIKDGEGLILYDEIIYEGKNLYEGKFVG